MPVNPMSFAALFLGNFALQAVLRNTPELRALPVALIPENTPRACILQATPAARAAGVTPGMTPSQGLARCRELKIKTASREAEDCADAALFDYAWSISRFVEKTGAGICTVALDDRQPRDGAAWLGGLRQLHLEARIGIAPNPDLALLAAQSADDWREVHAAEALGELGIDILEPSPAIAAILRKWGIRTLHQFIRLGRDRLVERLGSEMLPLFDRAAGQIDRPLRYVMPREFFAEQIEFENEIETLEPLLFMVRRFLEQLVTRLECLYRVIAQLTLRLGLANGEAYVRVFKVPSPTGDVDVLFRMLTTHLENFRAEHPIASFHLSAVPSRPARQQFGLFESALRDPNQFYETLARLSALVGHEHVGTPALEPTHRPDAFRLLPECFRPASAGTDEVAKKKGSRPRAAPSAENDGRLATGLRLRRFRPPLPATVRAEPAPSFMESGELTGAVIERDGPMRLSGHWWCERAHAWSRNEWDVQLRDGPLCRIYEDTATGHWFLEGVYD